MPFHYQRNFSWQLVLFEEYSILIISTFPRTFIFFPASNFCISSFSCSHSHVWATNRSCWLNLEWGWVDLWQPPVFTTSICGCTFQGRGENTRKAKLTTHPFRGRATELHSCWKGIKVCFFVILYFSLAYLKLERSDAGQMKVLMRNCAKA